MAKKEKFVFQSLDNLAPAVGEELKNINTPVQTFKSAASISTPTFSGGVSFQDSNFTKVTFDCSNDLLEQMKNYGYWEGLSQRDIIIEALNEFFSNKSIKERPDRVKNKKKVGRKPKSITNFMK